ENLAMVLGFAKKHGIPLASHDDTTAEQVDAAVRDGVVICEFPTTMEAARRAAERGLMVTLGAPNIVRGQSSTKNVSAMDVAEAGCLSCLSSDYVPASLLEAVFILKDRGVMSLPEAMRLVTLNPARTAGLTDRGALKEGLRADLCLVTLCGNSPIVRGVWKAGTRVF
ncbi:MAG: amidohydrolase family protein, partial [Desulfovibrio sp.]